MYFTVCIPTYNRAHTLSRALDSLTRQTFQDFETLIVDDGSSDETESVVAPYLEKCRAQYIWKKNGGKHSALNVGIARAAGEFFLILDSDDYLVDDGLEKLHALCEQIKEDDAYCGVLAKCQNLTTGEMIGDPVPQEYLNKLSYIDMHFRFISQNIDLKDCCECNKTKILKEYHFPEEEGMRFVPEALVFDQIGLTHSLLCSNDIVRVSEYLTDGMTKDNRFKEKNYVGFLYHYVSRLEKIIPNIQASFQVKVVAWWRYWQMVMIDRQKKGPRVKKVSFLGFLVRLGSPFLNLYYKKMYKKQI